MPKLILTVLSLIVLASTSQGADFLQGCFHNGDTLLYSKRVTIPSQNGDVVKTSISFPNAESVDGDFVVSALIALDKTADANGGYVRVTKGRIGMKEIKLDFVSSKDSSGIEYDVMIFGTPYK